MVATLPVGSSTIFFFLSSSRFNLTIILLYSFPTWAHSRRSHGKDCRDWSRERARHLIARLFLSPTCRFAEFYGIVLGGTVSIICLAIWWEALSTQPLVPYWWCILRLIKSFCINKSSQLSVLDGVTNPFFSMSHWWGGASLNRTHHCTEYHTGSYRRTKHYWHWRLGRCVWT